ncbi:MAG: 30S ribosomal protein S17 [Candidatus Micrarchaeia archaeon]
MVECNDKKCFKHGNVKLRGGVLQGVVVSDKGKRTVVVERPLTKYISKYERFARTHSRIAAHNPDCIGAKEGDVVKIAECRKLSRTKAWSVVEIVKRGSK